MKKHIGYAYLVGSLLLAGTAPLLASPAPAQADGSVITQQANNEWRASKLDGIAVYSSDNKKVGTISDLLVNSDGTAGAIVIGSGGVLGAGEKLVAVPFDKVHWSIQGRTAAQGSTARSYPTRAVLQMSKSDFDGAPTFTYESAKK